MTEKQDRPDLLEALDIASAKLLERAGLHVNVSAEAGANVELTEQCKVFSAVVAWLERRKDLAPPEKKESPFDAIRNQFNGASAEGGGSPRGRRGRPKKETGAGDQAASGTQAPDEIRPDA